MEEYTTLKRDEMLVVGIKLKTSNDPKRGPLEIPKHWDRFFKEQVQSRIPSKISDEVIALYCDYEGDYTKPYTMVIGSAVSSIDNIPEGMVFKKVPAGHYALFQAVGPHPEALINTWGKIWQSNSLDRTYTGDFEVYGPHFSQKSPPEIEVLIAIR